MVDEVVINPAIRDSVPIGGIIKFANQNINFIDSHGQEWLKTGYITQAFADYPEAIVNESIKFERSVDATLLWAYSPTLNRWAGVVAKVNTSISAATKIAKYSDDNFATSVLTSVADIVCQTLKWSQSHQLFIGTGHLPGNTSDRYFVTSPDGITWTRTASVYAGMYLEIDDTQGRVITERRDTQTLFYTDNVLAGSFTATGLPVGAVTVFSHPDFGVYCRNAGTFYRSTNGGTTWTEVVMPVNIVSEQVSMAAVNGTLYMVSITSSNWAFSSVDGVQFEQEFGWEGFGRIFSHDDYLLVVTATAVYRIKKIGQAVKVGEYSLASLGSAHVANGFVVALPTTNYSSGFAGELYFKYIGLKTSTTDEFVRIK